MGPSESYFHSLFKICPNSPDVVITGVHAPTKRGEKDDLWKELMDNPLPQNTPWLVVGDHNGVVDQLEKMGGRQVTHVQGRNMES